MTQLNAQLRREPATLTPVLTLTGIGKSFPGVRALDGAELELRAGEVHVLFGENGAGKSTLINIISGVFSQDEGQMMLNGKPCQFRNVHEARAAGIGAMFQEFSLAPHLTVEENIVLGNEPARGGVLRPRETRALVDEVLERCSFALDPRREVSTLNRAEQQMVEMAKVLLVEPKILILDEPTASLSEAETQTLFALVDELRAKGVAIIYITHRMREINQIADRITVMRDGRHVATLDADLADHDRLVELMTGRKVGNLYPSRSTPIGEPILTLENFGTEDQTLHDISLTLRRGEILGLAGLVGCGKSEIGRAIFGAQAFDHGTLTVEGTVIDKPTPRAMLRQGVCYISSDRRHEGLMMGRNTSDNIALSALPRAEFSRNGILRLISERRLVKALAEKIHLRPMTLDADVANYSGGNQQKIVIARALATRPEILILDEPTVGVDVGARVEIYKSIVELADEGTSILLISSDMPEIIHLCDRCYSVSGGTITDEMTASEVSEARLLDSFFREHAPKD